MHTKLKHKNYSKSLLKLLSISALLFCTNTYGKNDNIWQARTWLPDYYSVHGNLMWNKVRDVHTQSAVIPAGGVATEIVPFSFNKHTGGISAAIGKKFVTTSNIIAYRPELEYIHVFNKIDKKNTPAFVGIDSSFSTEIKIQALMLNFIVDKPLIRYKSNIFIGVGAGADYKGMKSTLVASPDKFTKNSSRHNFVWELILGANKKVYKNINLSASYKFINFGNIKYGTMNTTPSGLGGTTILSDIRSKALISHTFNFGVLVDID